jgi:hypothetical protein
MFERVARALCPGESWPAAMADLMRVRIDTIRHWRSGRSHLRRDHFESLLMLLQLRQKWMRDTEEELRQWLAKQPPSPGDQP